MKEFTCDLSSCVLNKRGECMKTFYNECPYYKLVLAKAIERKKKLEFAKEWAKDYNEKVTKKKNATYVCGVTGCTCIKCKPGACESRKEKVNEKEK